MIGDLKRTQQANDGTRLSLGQAIQDRVGLAVSANDEFAVIGENQRNFRIIRLEDFTTVQEIVGHEQRGWQWAAFSGDGRSLYTIGWDGRLPISPAVTKSWSQYRPKGLDAYGKAHYDSIEAGVRVHETVSNDVFRWDIETGEVVARLGKPKHAALSLAASPDGNEIAYLLARQDVPFNTTLTICRVDSSSGTTIAEYPLPKECWETVHQQAKRIPTLDFSGSGSRLLVRTDTHLAVLSRETGKIQIQRGNPEDRDHPGYATAIYG